LYVAGTPYFDRCFLIPSDPRMASSQSPLNADLAPQVRRRQARTVMLAGALLVFAPLIVSEAPREQARWYFAAALEYQQQQRTAAALESLNRALELDLRQPDYWLTRARWSQREGRLEEAFADLRQAVNLAPHDRVIDTLMERSDIFHQLELWDRAVDDWKLIHRLHQKGFPGPATTSSVLNGLAYSRALANTELDQALLDINEALRRAPDSPMYLDTRGYIHYRRGEFKKAQADLDAAVASFRAQWKEQIHRITAERRQRLHTDELDAIQRALDRALAAILYHRLLVFDVVDQSAAEKDEAEIRSLGFDPTKVLY
jgi:tetratricopeptide (TPR) repeat protein